MCTYLKNMEGYKLNDLKLKEFDSIQEIFDRAFKRVEDDKETTEIKKLMEIIPDEEEVEIDAIPLAAKSPSIIDWKIHKKGRKSYYQIIRADGKSQMYMIFSHMLKSFDSEDLKTLYKLIYMLVEKKYPLTPSTLTMMLEKKLMIDYESEMAYQLLKFIIKQLKNEEGDVPQNDATCLMAIDSQEVCLKRNLLPDDWIVDSGCTKHMTRNRRLFTLYKAYDGGHVVFGSNLKGKVVSGGNITHDSITITNVENVSSLALNLISVGQLLDDDCVVSFTKLNFTISKNGKTLAKGHMRNGLYTYKLGDNSKQQICLASVVDNSTLWHKRYRIFTKGQKSSQTEQNRARNWKERKKLKPKAYPSIADQPGPT
ncbi:retrotransposon protein [Tanacetum coccineum]